MFCEKCGKEIKETEKFCENCGALNKNYRMPEQSGIAESGAAGTNLVISGTKKKSDKKKVWIIAAVILVCIVVIGLFNTCGSGDKVLRYNLTVINNTGIDIYAFYASEQDVDNWEEDVLGNDILYAGDSVNIKFTITEDDLDWDFAMEDMYGNMIEFYGLSFADCDISGATLVLEYDGYEGTATLY